MSRKCSWPLRHARTDVSEATAKTIDEEIRRIVEDAYARARRHLIDHLDELHTLARGLLEYETLSGDEIRALLRGETIVREPGGSNHEPPTKPREAGGGRRSSVPTSGVAGQPGFGTGPEPQPGA